MKATQGLDALAALCGGAPKVNAADPNSVNKSNEESTKNNAMAPPPSTPNANNNTVMQQALAAKKSQIGQHQQLYQTILNAAAYGNIGNILASSAAGNMNQQNILSSASDPVNQLAYYNQLYNSQFQAAAAAQFAQLAQQQQMQQQNNNSIFDSSVAQKHLTSSLAAGGIDQAKIAQALLAVQQQQQKGQNPLIQPGGVVPQSNKFDAQTSATTSPGSTPILSGITEPATATTNANKKITNTPIVPAPSFDSTFVAPQITADVPELPQDVDDTEDKKRVKRAANRRSAQLSRKRKKQFIEELKEENDELRRKELILRSIPDLIVVFDSAGRLSFVSQSVGKFLHFTPEKLEGTSFWDRLCDESVRLLKAAFMDALAARKPGMDTAPLGNGLWELTLIDSDGEQKLVILNGIVHFIGDSPECVCSIRPTDDATESVQQIRSSKDKMSTTTQSHPKQMDSSFIGSSSQDSMTFAKGKKAIINRQKRQRANPISDVGSIISDTS